MLQNFLLVLPAYLANFTSINVDEKNMRSLAILISYGLILFGISLSSSLVSYYIFGFRFIPPHLWSNASTDSSSTVVSVDQQLVGASNRSDNATSTTASSTNTTRYEYCHLSDLNIPGPIHLWSMIAARSSYMIGHFIGHYKDVGVPVDNMSFLIQFNTKNELEDAFAVLAESGVNIDRILVTETYHSDIKRDAINKHIKSLPSDAWLVYPDLDEFFHFPCVVPMPFKVVCGHMVDRFASTDSDSDVPIPAIDSSTDNGLSKQYPKCGKVRGRKGFITIADDRKILLLPVSVEYPRMGRYRAQFKNSHKLQYKFLERIKNSSHSQPKDFKVKCEIERGSIDHYAWSSEQIALTYKKFVIYVKSAQEKDGEERKNDEFRLRIYRLTLETMNHNTTAATWSLKSNWAETIRQHEVPCPEMAKRGEGMPIGREKRWEGTTSAELQPRSPRQRHNDLSTRRRQPFAPGERFDSV